MKKFFFSALFAVFSTWSVAQTIYPMDGNPITACEGVFTDSGGVDNDYMANENFTTTICSANSNQGIKLTFSEVDLSLEDNLCFFDGTSVAAPSLGCSSDFAFGTFTIESSAANSSNCITVTFQSDGMDEGSGWAAALSCIQPCQTFTAAIANSVPPIFPVDTGYIDICLGDAISLTAATDYFQNNTLYTQSDATSTFRWDMGDGTVLFGENVNHVYDELGGYYVRLQVLDVQGCENQNVISQRIRVTGISEIGISGDYFSESCGGDTVLLVGAVDSNATLYFSNPLTNNTAIGIPDGTGASIFSKLIVDEYPANSVLTDETQLPQICLTIEHSWARDLEIKLICPTGQSIILHDHPGQSGGEVFLGEPFEGDESLLEVIPGVGYEYCFTPNATNGTFIEYMNANLPSGQATLPAGDYNAFDPITDLLGCPLNGEWTLQVTDLWGIDNGYLFSWSMGFSGVYVLSAESFSVGIVDQGWLPSSSIVTSLGDSIFVVVDSTEEFTYQINFDNGCMMDTTVQVEILPDSLQACADCSELIIDAGEDVNIDCVSPQIILDASNSTHGAYFSYQWTSSDGAFLSSTDSLTVTVAEPGTYIFTLTSLVSDCELADTVEVLPFAGFPVADLGDDQVFPCNATEMTLSAGNSSVGAAYTYQWVTTDGIILSNTENAIIDQSGTYTLIVTNTVNGCFATDEIVITEEVFFPDVANATCDNADGAISISTSSGVMDPQFAWSTGETGSMIENLSQGWYSVTVTYNDSCTVHENIFVDEGLSCKVQIRGTVINDASTPDCTEDLGVEDVSQILLHLMPLDIYTYTDEQGDYEFIVDNGNYTIEVILPAYLKYLCPSDGILMVDAPINGTILPDNDFFVDYSDGAYDLSISCFMGIARVGDEHVYSIEYCNEGAVTKSGVITLVHDSIETNIATTPLPTGWTYDEMTNTATWEFTDLEPGACISETIILDIPTTAMIGDILEGSLSITSDGDDFEPSNNTKSWSKTVIASYDPNDKQVYTASGGNEFGGPIYESDTTLYYQIRFQNTGTDTAFTVVIRDTLDSSLDVTTIRPGIASHSYALDFEGHNVLVFNFENIMLPDSNVNEPASNGYVTFSIDRRLPLPIGTMISNSAAIYFDYNVPVITNEVVSVLTEPVATNNLQNTIPLLELFPNPNEGEFTVFYQLKKRSDIKVSVVGLYGNVVSEVAEITKRPSGNYSDKIELREVPPGVYFLCLNTSEGMVTKRFVKVK